MNRKIAVVIFSALLWTMTIIFPVELWAATGVTSSVKFRKDRKAVIMSLSGLNNASSVSYSLSYNANGIPQGVMGTIKPKSSKTETRELLFGTCSKNVCRYHTNISNAKLTITSKLKSGQTTRKTYNLKV